MLGSVNAVERRDTRGFPLADYAEVFTTPAAKNVSSSQLQVDNFSLLFVMKDVIGTL